MDFRVADAYTRGDVADLLAAPPAPAARARDPGRACGGCRARRRAASVARWRGTWARTDTPRRLARRPAVQHQSGPYPAADRAGRAAAARVRPLVNAFVDDVLHRRNLTRAHALLDPALRRKYALRLGDGHDLPFSVEHPAAASASSILSFQGPESVGFVTSIDEGSAAASGAESDARRHPLRQDGSVGDRLPGPGPQLGLRQPGDLRAARVPARVARGDHLDVVDPDRRLPRCRRSGRRDRSLACPRAQGSGSRSAVSWRRTGTDVSHRCR